MNSMLLAVAQSAAVRTPSWSFNIALVMILCNVLGLLLVRLATQDRGSKPASPVPGFGLPQLLAGTSFGHILGAGTILSLTNLGIL